MKTTSRATKRTTAGRTARHPHVDAAQKYARDIVAGRILACKWVILACMRHLANLQSEKDRGYPYKFDRAKAERVCKFIELLPHTKGRWAIGTPGVVKSNLIKLEPWQCFVLCCIFGWVRKSDGLRRFRTAYEEVPRKNAKSIKGAGIGLYGLAADGEFGAEVYSGATSEKQAWEVFRPARLMAERTPELQEAYGISVNASNLNIPENGSRFEPLIGKPGDGSSPSLAIVDEYHEHQTDDLVETMRTGMGAREQPLLFVITTAGSDIAGPCYALRTEAQKVLEGTLVNEELFAIIYTIDTEEHNLLGHKVKPDEWTSEAALRKANPNYDVSVDGEFLRSQQRDAINSSRKQNTFKTKHLNIWVTARQAWMNMEWWNHQADRTLKPEQFAKEPAYIGLDLASKIDLTAKVKVFRRLVDGEVHYYAFCNAYLPESKIEEPENSHYQGWMHDGLLTATDGDMIDYEVIRTDILDDDDIHGIAELGFDPYGASQLAQELGNEGIPTIEIPQRVQYLSEPMKMVEALAKAGRLHHDGNEVLAWAVSNVTAKTDANDNVFPRKERVENKIDPAVALIMALSRAIVGNQRKKTSVYDKRGIVSV